MSETKTTPPAPEPVEAPKPQPPAQSTPNAPAQPDAEQEAPLGESGLKALREERAAREQLEKAMKDQRAALLKAFGVEEGQSSGEDIVATLQQQVAKIQHDGLVERVARSHGITDEADVEILRDARDEAHMARLAARLKVTAPQAPAAPAAPAPDPSQGSAPIGQEAADDAAYKAFFPSSS